jgi:endoglucanase
MAHDWKISVIRAAMGVDSAKHLENNTYGGGGNVGYLGNKETHKGRVENVIKAAIRRGIYVIIDWHGHYLYPNTNSVANASREFFVEMAEKWGAYPNVIYEIFNEPKDIGGDDIVTYSNAVISSSNGIRSKDSKNIIIIGNPGWSSEPDFSANISGTNLVYAMHFYAASHRSDYRSRVTSALGMGRAVFVSEFGMTNYDGDGGIDVGETGEWIKFMENNNVSWVNWAVGNKTETSNIFNTSVAGSSASSWTDNNRPSLKESGRHMRDTLRTRNSGYFGANPTYSINTTTEGEGSIERSGGNGPYSFNTTVKLTASPASGWTFVGWDGDAMGTNPSLDVRVAGINYNIKAIFEQGSMIKNGQFTNNIQNWASGTGGTGSVTLSHDAGSLKITVNNGGEQQANARLQQTGINLETGKKYELKYRAKASAGGRTVTARFTNTNRDRNYMDPPRAVNLSTDWQNVTEEFSMCYRHTTPGLISDASALLMFEFGGSGGTSWSWNLDDVSLEEKGTTVCATTDIAAVPAAPQKTAWSLARANGAVTLRGPAEHGAKVTLYDIRGKAVRTMNAKDGLALGASVPAGNYFLVVRNAAGAEVFRDKVSLVR